MKKWLKKLWNKNNPEVDPALNEQPFLLKAEALSEKDIGLFKWDSNHNDDLLGFSNNDQTVEWVSNNPKRQGKHTPAWVPVLTRSQLHSGRYRWDFVIEEMAEAQIGIGFMLQWNVGPDWGFFGYLGASNTAWSYDPSTGDIVNNTQSIKGGLPKFEDGHRGVITLVLDLPLAAKGEARFIVNGVDTPHIELPESSVILPAACLLKETQKVTLANFERR